MRQADKLSIFRLIPPKLAVTLIVIAILYTLLQPLANSKFGWSLPSTASILELDFSDDPPATSTATKDKPSQESPKSHSSSTKETSEKPKKSASASNGEAEAEKKGPVVVKKTETAKQRPAILRRLLRSWSPNEYDDSDLLYGLLKKIGRDRYLSPAGIEYGPGSEEGHRLKHIERHLTDQPSRAGPHGVFDGSMEDF